LKDERSRPASPRSPIRVAIWGIRAAVLLGATALVAAASRRRRANDPSASSASRASTGDALAPRTPPTRMSLSNRRLSAATLLCVAALVAIEAALLAPGHLLAAAIADGAFVTAILTVTAHADPQGAVTEDRRVLLAMRALVLVALARVIAFGLPLREGSAALDTLVVAVLVGVAAIGIARRVGVSLRSLLSPRLPRLQLGVAIAGLALGLIAFKLGASRLWPAGAHTGRVVLALLAAVAAAVIEEVVFRGVVQVSLQRALGRVGLIATTVLFTATYLSLSSASLVLVVALVGLVSTYAVAASGSLTGATAGHVLFVVSAGWLWPVVIGPDQSSWHGAGVTVALAVGLFALAAPMVYRDL
jgi:membrane protease YdiL (CAAX protease family)